MESEKLIHLKFENNEAVLAKKDLLLMQSELIRLIVKMREFQRLRSLELKNKLKINSKIKSINLNLAKLDKSLPDVERPKILKPHLKDLNNVPEEIKTSEKTSYKNNFEKELEEIQNRLRLLDEKL